MALTEIHGNILCFFVIRQFMWGDFSGVPSGEFSELTCQSPQVGNTEKYRPCSSIFKESALGRFFHRVAMSVYLCICPLFM